MEADKFIRVDKDTHRALGEIAAILGVSLGQAVRWLVNDGLPRVREPKDDDPLGRLAILNQPYEPMTIGSENQGGY